MVRDFGLREQCAQELVSSIKAIDRARIAVSWVVARGRNLFARHAEDSNGKCASLEAILPAYRDAMALGIVP